MFGFQEVLRRGKKMIFFFLFNLIMKNAKIKNKKINCLCISKLINFYIKLVK